MQLKKIDHISFKVDSDNDYEIVFYTGGDYVTYLHLTDKVSANMQDSLDMGLLWAKKEFLSFSNPIHIEDNSIKINSSIVEIYQE